MMKNRAPFEILKRAALVAALFSFGCATGSSEVAKELNAKPVLKAADDRGQRLYDQAVKLDRRYAGQAKSPAEPFKSILTELSLYHEEDLATYLSDMGTEGKRSIAVEVGPWAQARLARFLSERGDFEASAEAWQQLRERYAGRMVIEPADGMNASKEKADPAGLVGEMEAYLNIAKQGDAKNLIDTISPRAELLQTIFGSELSPCQSGDCASYSRKAIEALWQALALEKADYKTWRKATQKFAKRENSTEFKAAILSALAEGERKLGKVDDAKDDSAALPKSEKGLPQGVFSNLVKK